MKTCCSRKHTDCFAYMNGACTLLKDDDFGKRDCPFYKSWEQYGGSNISETLENYRKKRQEQI